MWHLIPLLCLSLITSEDTSPLLYTLAILISLGNSLYISFAHFLKIRFPLFFFWTDFQEFLNYSSYSLEYRYVGLRHEEYLS